MTITEFLLARLAEDAEKIRDDWSARYGGLHIIGQGVGERMERDVQAKRAIVEEAETAATNARYPDHQGGVAEGLEWAVRTLALVYVEHPDYRDEWRPW